LAGSNAGRSWLDSLQSSVEECRKRWDLNLGEPFLDSFVSLVLPADDYVLKIQFPHRESHNEADALRAWNGHGAIRLIDHWPAQNALLLERCTPGDHLSTAGADAGIGAMIELIPQLWIPAGEPFPLLHDEVARWVQNLPLEFAEAGEPFERSLLDRIVETLADLASSQGEPVLLHQDLHGDNVLRAKRAPWLAIDPKPLVGEREFGLSPIIRSDEFGRTKSDACYRLDRLSSELGVDRERSRLWAAGQAVAWGFEAGQVLPGHIEMARWLLAG
jgi:streptomycin 6-kinase